MIGLLCCEKIKSNVNFSLFQWHSYVVAAVVFWRDINMFENNIVEIGCCVLAIAATAHAEVVQPAL